MPGKKSGLHKKPGKGGKRPSYKKGGRNTRIIRLSLRKIEMERRRKAFEKAEKELWQGLKETMDLYDKAGTPSVKKKLGKRKELAERQIRTVRRIQSLEEEIYHLVKKVRPETGDQAVALFQALRQRTALELKKENFDEVLESVLKHGMEEDVIVRSAMDKKQAAVRKTLTDYGVFLLGIIKPKMKIEKRRNYVEDFLQSERKRRFKLSHVDPKRPILSELINKLLIEQKERVRYFSNKMDLFELRLDLIKKGVIEEGS